MGEKKTYICPTIGCKKTFTTPLKTLNLQDNPSEPYYACPICLTRIEPPEQTKLEKVTQQPKPVEAVHKQNSKDANKPSGCAFHLGYLSTRGKKEIPEDCLTCRDIVECMLNKMRLEQ
jgi:hypothetical protein